MDEREWLACTDPDRMLRSLQPGGKLTERKARLFAVACCRRNRHLLADERLEEAVAVAEAHADGDAGAEAMADASDAGNAAYRAAYEHLTGYPPPGVVSIMVTLRSGETGVAALLDSHPRGEAPDDTTPRAAAVSASEAVLRAASPARFLPWTA